MGNSRNGILRKIISSIIHRIWVTFLTFVLLLAAPTIILALSPFYLYRYCLHKLFKPLLRPDLGSIMTTRSTICSADDIYGKPDTNLIAFYEVEGGLDIEELRNYILERMVFARYPESGELMYPELRQSLIQWGGYNFWKDDPDFDIKNHCNYYEETGLGPDQLIGHEMALGIKKKLLKKPMIKNRPLWETLVIRNYFTKDFKEGEEPKSIFITRFHHSLADGFAIISSVLRLHKEIPTNAFGIPPKPPNPLEIQSRWTRIFHFLSNLAKILRTPYDLAEQLSPFLSPNIPPKLLSKEISLSICDPIPFGYIRTIAKSNGVSVSAIITAGFTSAVRSYFLRSGKPVPTFVPCLFPLPAPGHSLKMRNLMSFFFMRLPIGESDPFQRLKDIESQFNHIKNSHLPLVNYICIPIFGALPVPLLRKSPLSFYNMTTLSSFPGPRIDLELLRKAVTHISFGSGLCPTNLGMLLTGLTYKGFFNLMGMGDKAIIPSDEDMGVLFEQQLHKEFQILAKCEA